ncbi:hypothetical protein GCM10027425_12390 [Alteromonas gracilis]
MSAKTTASDAAPQNQVKPTRGRRRKGHLWWRKDGEFAAPLGIQVRYFCGRWGYASLKPTFVQAAVNLETDEVVLTGTYRNDCLTCLAAYEAAVRRQAREGRRSET